SDLLSSLAADLRGLAPPPEDAGVIDDYLDTLESSVTTTSELADAVSANQTAGGAPSAEMRQLGARRTRT
ncbi:MAG: hypothetical protein ABI726_09365, partial [bacterium]